MEMGNCAAGAAHNGKQRLAGLDGLRGLAILGVMLHHFGIKPGPWFDWGPVAPTVFFIISGFLITGTLCRMHADGKPTAFQMTGFHFSRLVRLAPVLYLMLLVGWFSGLPEYRDGLLWHLGFLSNIKMAFTGEWAGSISQLWSLSKQEQFYLIWPLLFLLPKRWWAPSMIFVLLTAVIFRWACIQTGTSGMIRWLLLPGSFDAFAAGGLLAMFLKTSPSLAFKMRSWVFFPLAIACWFAARGLRHLDDSMPLVAMVELFEIAFFCWVLLGLVTLPHGRIARLFSFGPLVGIGRISYGLFIWHMLVVCSLGPLLEMYAPQVPLPAKAALFVSVSFLVAWLSWIAFERPILLWAKSMDFRSLTIPNSVVSLAKSAMARFAALIGSVKNAGRESA